MLLARVIFSTIVTFVVWATVSAILYVIYGVFWFPSEINSVGAWLKSDVPTNDALGFVLTRPAVLLSFIAAAGLIMIYQVLVSHVVYALVEEQERAASSRT
jgi:hypothetical protein